MAVIKLLGRYDSPPQRTTEEGSEPFAGRERGGTPQSGQKISALELAQILQKLFVCVCERVEKFGCGLVFARVVGELVGVVFGPQGCVLLLDFFQGRAGFEL